MRVVTARAGNRYYRCDLSARDARYPRYPVLPVLACEGREPATSGTGGVLSADSSPAIERLQVDAWRRMSSVDKARAVDGLSRAAQALALAGIRQRHPGASERECFLRLAVLKLGSEETLRLYPDAAALLDPSA